MAKRGGTKFIKKAQSNRPSLKNEFAQGISEGIDDAISNFKSKGKLTFDTTKLPPRPRKITRQQIIKLRKEMRMSQRVFASFLNVSPKTVQAWEQQGNQPSGASLRLLQLVKKYPELLWKEFPSLT